MTHRYTRPVGLMTSVIKPRLKAHMARLKGSMGSGTDWGRTTVCAAAGCAPDISGRCKSRNIISPIPKRRQVSKAWLFPRLDGEVQPN